MQGIKTTQPVPEIGSNVVDGKFIRQGFNWYFTPRSYAKVLLSYMENNGLGGGLSGNYILNNESEGEIRLGSNEKERSYWGLTHYFALGPKLVSKDDEQWLIYDFYKAGGKYSYELEAKYSFRERPNLDRNIGPFTRVSMTPQITLRSNRKPIPYLGEPFTYFAEASHANVSEEVLEYETPSPEGYTTSSPRTHYFADVSYTNDIGWLGNLNIMFDAAFSDYGKDYGSWDRARQIVSLKQDLFDRMTLQYGHVHYMMQRGFTPYMFEGYYYSPYDQFMAGLRMKAWFSSFQIKTSYNLPDWDPYDVDYEWNIGLHCYNLIFEYRAMRKEFNFSFELTPSRW